MGVRQFTLRTVRSLAVLCVTASSAYGQSSANLIETPVEEQPTTMDARRESRVTISRPELIAEEREPATLHVELFADLAFRVVRDGLVRTGNRVTWLGRIEGVPDSSVRFDLVDGSLNGHILGTTGAFRISPHTSSPGTYVVQELVSAGDGSETNRFSIIPFLEGTDVFWTVASGRSLTEIVPNKLEANIFPHLVVAQTFTDVLDVESQERRGLAGVREFSYSISGTPAVRLRMLRLTSAPVRTPSYMPRGNFQLLWVRGLKDCDPLAATARRQCQAAAGETKRLSLVSRLAQARSALAALRRITVWEAHVIVGHHSNGQAGCLNAIEQRDPPETGDCVPPTPLSADTINYKDGSFSTNYVRAGINWTRNRLVGPDAVRELRLMAEVEQHPRSWIDPRIADIYGRTRVNALASYAWRDMKGCRKRTETSLAATINPGVVEGVTHDSYTAQLTCFPATNGGWGLFVRLFTGQDYYNVGFLKTITRVHAGMTFNQSGFFRFRRASGTAR